MKFFLDYTVEQFYFRIAYFNIIYPKGYNILLRGPSQFLLQYSMLTLPVVVTMAVMKILHMSKNTCPPLPPNFILTL